MAHTERLAKHARDLLAGGIFTEHTQLESARELLRFARGLIGGARKHLRQPLGNHDGGEHAVLALVGANAAAAFGELVHRAGDRLGRVQLPAQVREARRRDRGADLDRRRHTRVVDLKPQRRGDVR